MSWLLNAIYICFLVLGSPWLLWRYAVQGKNRRGWDQKILGRVKVRTSSQPCLWLHAVSVGEVNLLAPVILRLKQSRPDWEIVISTTTETGYDLAQQRYAEHYVFFCPFDFTWAVKRALQRLRPTALVLAELELWPNLIRTTRNAGIPVAVVNGRLSASSLRGYQKIRWLIAPTLKQLSWVAAQNETYASRFCELGCDPQNVGVIGSVKFDGVETDRNNPRTRSLAVAAGFDSEDFVWVAGSTQLEEDLIIAEVYRQLASKIPSLRLILVPRHPDRCGTLARRLEQVGIPSRFRSELISGKESRGGRAQGANIGELEPVLIVDVIGELGGWWGCGNLAYVGGSMGRRGGQNMIEPAAFGIPVSFGPDTENFRDIVDEFLARDAATVLEDAEAVQAFVSRVFAQTDWAQQIGMRAQSVVLSHTGASLRTVDGLCEMVEINAPESGKRAANHAA